MAGHEYVPGGQVWPYGGSAVNFGTGRLDVVGTNSNRHVVHTVQGGGGFNNPWNDLGGVFERPPACCWRPDGTFWVFCTGTDNLLWGNLWNGRYNGWGRIAGSGTYASGPAAVSWGPGRLDVVAVAIDGSVRHGWNVAPDPGWGWENLGGLAYGYSGWSMRPAITGVYPSGNLDVYVGGQDGGIYHKWSVAGKWYGWENLGGQGQFGAGTIGVSAVTYPGPRHILVAPGNAGGSSPFGGLVASTGVGGANVLYEKTFNYYQTGWDNWHVLGSGFIAKGAPGLATKGYPGHDAIFDDNHGRIEHDWWP